MRKREGERGGGRDTQKREDWGRGKGALATKARLTLFRFSLPPPPPLALSLSLLRLLRKLCSDNEALVIAYFNLLEKVEMTQVIRIKETNERSAKPISLLKSVAVDAISISTDLLSVTQCGWKRIEALAL